MQTFVDLMHDPLGVSMRTRYMKLYKLLVSLLLPALAIFVAALAQHMLITAWPGIREIRFPIATVDSYFFVLSSGFLCFLAGAILRRHVGSRSGFVCAVIAPFAFLCLFLWPLVARPLLELGVKIGWLRPSVLFFIVVTTSPLLGVALGWSYSGTQRRKVTA